MSVFSITCFNFLRKISSLLDQFSLIVCTRHSVLFSVYRKYKAYSNSSEMLLLKLLKLLKKNTHTQKLHCCGSCRTLSRATTEVRKVQGCHYILPIVSSCITCFLYMLVCLAQSAEHHIVSLGVRNSVPLRAGKISLE